MPPASRTMLAAAALCLASLAATPARADDDPATRAKRWADLAHALFGNRPVQNGSAFLGLDAPDRAQDAALVPITITAIGAQPIKDAWLVIDDNPSPMAAHFSFGPAADPREIRLRVRVDQYTDVHAVAETQDGHLYAVSHFVKAAGGCSAPAAAAGTDALAGLGQMKLRMLQPFQPDKPLPVELLIRHPNFNGMQMDQVTRLYTMPRFINAVDVSYAGTAVFHLDSDISMSSDPAITFTLLPHTKAGLTVVAHDSKNTVFSRSFELPPQGS